MKRHCIIRVFGQVQGVGFRYAAMKKAKQLGLAGLARNNADGSVTIRTEGEAQLISAFLDWCREGPAFARVEYVEHAWQDRLAGFSDFTVH